MIKQSLLFFIVASFCCVSASAQNTQHMQVLKTFPVSSDGGWDYIQLNSENDELYVSHATHVNILNKATGDSVGVIENTTGVHGIAFDPVRKLGFTSNGRLNNVTVFDTKNNEVILQIPTGKNPDAIAYEPFSKTIITCNGRSNDLTIIDPATLTVLHTIPLSGRPETAVSDDHGHFFINLEDKNSITVLDTRSFKITTTWLLTPGEGPAGLAIDKKTNRLFVGCENMLVIMDGGNGKIIDTKRIGEGCDGVAFDEERNNIYSSNGEGTISLVHEKNKDYFSAPETIITKKGARTIVCDPKTHLLYLPAAEYEPPTAGDKRRPKMKPASFGVIVVGKK